MNKQRYDMLDVVVGSIAAFCVALGMYILFAYPELQYWFWMTLPWMAIGYLVAYWFVWLWVDARKSDDRRTRSHYERRWQ